MGFVSKWKTEICFTAIAAEFMGTAILLYFGCLGCAPSAIPFQVASVFAAALTVAIQTCGHVSGGHFNPAVTVSALIYGLISVRIGLVYVLAQLVGATVGYGLALISAPKMYGLNEVGSTFCSTIIHPEVALHEGFLTEFLFTFLLVLLCCSVWDRRNDDRRDSVSIKFGIFIFGAVLVAGPLTGASLNPARTFGPSLINGNWDSHWLYWLAPLSGGCASVILYKIALLDKIVTEVNKLEL